MNAVQACAEMVNGQRVRMPYWGNLCTRYDDNTQQIVSDRALETSNYTGNPYEDWIIVSEPR